MGVTRTHSGRFTGSGAREGGHGAPSGPHRGCWGEVLPFTGTRSRPERDGRLPGICRVRCPPPPGHGETCGRTTPTVIQRKTNTSHTAHGAQMKVGQLPRLYVSANQLGLPRSDCVGDDLMT